jgi:hypothetical protein
LYEDAVSGLYAEQIARSKNRYRSILEQEKTSGNFRFISVSVDTDNGSVNYNNYDGINGLYLQYAADEEIEGAIFQGRLLFNQTKIFFGDRELGFFNKSSLRGESRFDFEKPIRQQVKEGFPTGNGKFRTDFPFYVIGDFATFPLVIDPPVGHGRILICYDVDALLNLPVDDPRSFCLFASNTHPDLLASIVERKEKGDEQEMVGFDGMYICADSEGRSTDDLSYLSDDKEMSVYGKAVTGVFETSLPSLLPLIENSPCRRVDFTVEVGAGNKNDYKILVFGSKLSEDE